MDWKLKGYQSFSGEFLQTSVKISQRIVDEMNDSDLMEIRSICSDFERQLFAILSHYAHIVKERNEHQEPQAETQTAETYAETASSKGDRTEEPKNPPIRSFERAASNGK